MPWTPGGDRCRSGCRWRTGRSARSPRWSTRTATAATRRSTPTPCRSSRRRRCRRTAPTSTWCPARPTPARATSRRCRARWTRCGDPVQTGTPTMSGSRSLPRTVHVEHCMGTVFTIDVRDPGDWSTPVAEVVAWLHRVDRTFSTYREDSAIRRLQRGELRLEDAQPDVVAVLDLCREFERRTGGAFTSTPHGVVDPTGLVKGWAIERASELLRRSGSRNHAVNGGGDMQLAGETAPGRPWRVGISDPADRQRLIAVVSGRDRAVATSGVAERGRHIVDPRTGTAADRLTSVTIVGPHLTDADAYATAAFAMGDASTPWIEGLAGYQGLVVDTAGRTSQTSGFPGG